jgi:hypothetical protein
VGVVAIHTLVSLSRLSSVPFVLVIDVLASYTRMRVDASAASTCPFMGGRWKMRACIWHMSTRVVLVYTPVDSSDKEKTWSVTVIFGGTRHVTVVHRHILVAVAPRRLYSMGCHLLIVLTGETLSSDSCKLLCHPNNVHTYDPALGCPHGSKSSSLMVELDTWRTPVWTRPFTM